MIGKVKWFKSDKGYGFIESREHDVDIFVHHSSIVMDGFRYLDQGDRVSFDLEINAKGSCAVNVKRLEEEQ